MTTSLLVSWIAQVIQILGGFIVPRLIDQRLGQVTLGVWDLGWSLTSYFTLLTAGVGSTINRHVAVHRAGGDIDKLNCIVSSVALLQRCLGGLVLICTAILVWRIDFLLKVDSSDLLIQARWLVFFLGSSIAVGIAGSVYGGITTGSHGWTQYYSILIFTSLMSLLGMGSVLYLGFGLPGLGAVHCLSEFLGRVLRSKAAYQMCPRLEIRLKHAKLSTLKHMLSFGGKMFLSRMSSIILHQSISLMISFHLGPAALALFSRPRSLIRQAAAFPQKYAAMVVPRAAALYSKGDSDGIRKFAIESTRFGLCLSLPLICLIGFAGGPLLRFWMGDHYSNGSLVAILAFVLLPEIAYQPLNNILFGLGLHGRPGVASVCGAFVALVSAKCVLLFGNNNLTSIALAFGIPWCVTNGIIIPLYACKKIGVGVRQFIWESWKLPLSACVPLAFCILTAQALLPSMPVIALATGAASGFLLLLGVYWKYLVPDKRKEQLRQAFRTHLSRLCALLGLNGPIKNLSRSRT